MIEIAVNDTEHKQNVVHIIHGLEQQRQLHKYRMIQTMKPKVTNMTITMIRQIKIIIMIRVQWVGVWLMSPVIQ